MSDATGRKQAEVGIVDIRENPVALRSVSKDSEDYLGLVDSIRRIGILNPLSVRERVEGDKTFFELVDGLHRFSAALDAGLTTVPVIILSMDDASVLEAQVMANIHKVETKPVQYSHQLRRILTANPMMTEAELASRLSKSTQWIKERLGLTKITDKRIVGLVDEGKINLTNAYALAKLPAEEQADFVDRAMSLPPDQFCAQANARAKEIKEAKRAGKAAGPAEFQPVAVLQKVGLIKDELATPTIGPALVKEVGVKTAAEGFALGVKWVLSLDPKSVEAQKAKDVARKKATEEAKKARAKAKAEKDASKAKEKADEAAAKAAELTEA